MSDEVTEQPYQSSTDVRLEYIRQDVKEIKADVREIKADFISRREFTDAMNTVRNAIPNPTDHETRIRALETKVWKFIGALVVCQLIILPVILYLFYKVIST